MSKKKSKAVQKNLTKKPQVKEEKNPFTRLLQNIIDNVAEKNALTNIAVVGTTVNGKVIKSILIGDPLSYGMVGALSTVQSLFSNVLIEEEKVQQQLVQREQMKAAAQENGQQNGAGPGVPANKPPSSEASPS